MPWRCPACGTQIAHSDVEAKPRKNANYRCHICRLELVFDPRIDRLVVAPWPPEDQDERRLAE